VKPYHVEPSWGQPWHSPKTGTFHQGTATALAFTRYCHCQYGMAYGVWLQKGGLTRVLVEGSTSQAVAVQSSDRHTQAQGVFVPAFTRYCFTLKLYCGSPSSFYCRPPGLGVNPFTPHTIQYRWWQYRVKAHTRRRLQSQAVAVQPSDKHVQVQGVASSYGRRRAACSLARPIGGVRRIPERDRRDTSGSPVEGTQELGLYKIVFDFGAFVHESIIRVFPPPICMALTIAILLHDYSAVYDAPRTHLLYSIHHTVLAMAISCKGAQEHALCLREILNRTKLVLCVYVCMCCMMY